MGAMLSVDQARQILGARAEGKSDAEVEALVRSAYAYVRVLFETIQAERIARAAQK